MSHCQGCADLERAVAYWKGIIRAHNEDCESACLSRKAAGPMQCPMLGYEPRQCGDCPRDGKVEPIDHPPLSPTAGPDDGRKL